MCSFNENWGQTGAPWYLEVNGTTFLCLGVVPGSSDVIDRWIPSFLDPVINASITHNSRKNKGKGFPYSIPSIGPGADPSVQAVSPQVTVSHPPGGRLPLLFARPAVIFPAAEHHCLVTETHRCRQLAQGCYIALPSRISTRNLLSQVQRPTRCATARIMH